MLFGAENMSARCVSRNRTAPAAGLPSPRGLGLGVWVLVPSSPIRFRGRETLSH
jgi:hypothetical protein